LTEEQEIHVQGVLRSILPGDGGLWDRDKAHALTNEVARVELPERTFAAYLERWGFAPPKPLRKAHLANPVGMKAWMTRDYPVIAMQAREAGSEVLWLGCDELPDLRSRTVPVADHTDFPIGQLLLHVSNNRGNREWHALRSDPSTEDVLHFLDLVLHHHRSIELITPDIAPFKEARTQDWMASHQGRLNIHDLPPTRRSPLTED